MVNFPQKIAAITAGAVLGFLALEAKPAQAAEFYDYAEFEFVFEDEYFGGGFLSFDVANDNLNAIQSLLAGLGTKKISLEELKGATNHVEFNFNYDGLWYYPYKEIDFGGGNGSWTSNSLIGDPIFTFNSGELVGLELDLPTNITSYDYGGSSGHQEYSGEYTAYNNLFINGEQFSQEINVDDYWCSTVYYPPYPVTTECYGPESFYSYDYTGDINFTTIDPLELPPQSVPEPSTLAGLSLLGLGLLVKKKAVNPRQERD